MSRSFGLVKFKNTGNIYYCCYNGTCDYMYPYLFTAKECYNEETDCYCAISYCNKLMNEDANNQIKVSGVIEDIEIYADYGYGFYWQGKGIESARKIVEGFEPFEDVVDGTPEWVDNFLKHLG